GEAQPELAREPLDAAQAREVVVGVETRSARRPLRSYEATCLVQPQRLRVHADERCRDSDHVLGGVLAHATSAVATPALRSSSSRGFGPLSAASRSSASRCALVSFFGTTMRTRASRFPRR